MSQEIQKLSDLSSYNADEIARLTQTIEIKMKTVGNVSGDSTKKVCYRHLQHKQLYQSLMN